MDKFKDLIMKVSEDVCPDQRSFIEAQLTDFVSKFRTPDHPPYAAMIHNAIQELNQKGGSSKESISQYIKQQHTDLPLAHNSLLKHHLGELCNSGEIVMTRKHLYKLAGAGDTLDMCFRPEKEKLNKKKKGSKQGHDRLLKNDEESNKYVPCGKVMGEHDICNTEKDDFIGEDMEMNEYKADRVGELNLVVKRTKRQETGEMVKQSQQPPSISKPVAESNEKVNYFENTSQPDISTPERPPGFEFALYESQQVQDQFEMIANSERLPESGKLQQGDEQFEYQNSQCLRSTSSLMLPDLSPLQNQQQQLELSSSQDLLSVKSKDVKYVRRYHQPIKQYQRRKRLKSQTQETKPEDLGKFEQILPKKHSGFLFVDESESSRAKSQQEFEYCEDNKKPEVEFCREKQAPESELSQQQFEFCEVNKMLEFEICREKQTSEPELSDSHIQYKSGLKRPIKQQATIKLGQMLRRSPRLSKPNETCTSSSDVLQDHPLGIVEFQKHNLPQQVEKSPQLNMNRDFVSLTQKLQQLHLRAEDYSQTGKQTATKLSGLVSAQVQVDESPKLLPLQAKPSFYKKWCSSQSDIQTSCFSLSLALEDKVGQATQLQSLEKSSALQYLGQNIPPKLRRGSVNMQPMMWDNQKQYKQQTPRRGRGRPPKIKSREVNSNCMNNSQNNNQHTAIPTQM